MVFAFTKNAFDDGPEMLLRHSNIIMGNRASRIVRACKKGDISKFQRLFSERCARPGDLLLQRNDETSTLLTVSRLPMVLAEMISSLASLMPPCMV